MLIFMTGASGFVGRVLSLLLAESGHRLRCLTRQGSKHPLPFHPEIQPVFGNLFDEDSLVPHLKGVDAVIHLVGIIREVPSQGIFFEKLHHQATATLVTATQKAGVKRYLHMSANGTRADAVSTYHLSKWRAEECVRASGLEWTIFRPSLIYGVEDQFIRMLSGLIRRLPLIPVIGDGCYRLQPVPVEQVAAGFAHALRLEKTIGKIYHCGGADCISYNQLLDQIAAALGRKKPRKIFQPLALMRPLIRLMQHLPPFPMTSDQLQMLLEGNCCDNRPWAEDCAVEPLSLAEGLAYLQKR